VTLTDKAFDILAQDIDCRNSVSQPLSVKSSKLLRLAAAVSCYGPNRNQIRPVL